MTMSRPNASTRKPVTADPTSWALTQHNLAEDFAELNSMNHTLTHRYTPRVGWYQYRAEYGWSRDELNHTLSEIRGLMARARPVLDEKRRGEGPYNWVRARRRTVGPPRPGSHNRRRLVEQRPRLGWDTLRQTSS